MSDQTDALVAALNAVNQHIPRVVTALEANALPAIKQREFASLLTELGGLLHAHAETARPRGGDRAC
ncbi:MAG: hypothetical protein ACRDQ7_24715 [Haloechinothrix sp.]